MSHIIIEYQSNQLAFHQIILKGSRKKKDKNFNGQILRKILPNPSLIMSLEIFVLAYGCSLIKIPVRCQIEPSILNWDLSKSKKLKTIDIYQETY